MGFESASVDCTPAIKPSFLPGSKDCFDDTFIRFLFEKTMPDVGYFEQCVAERSLTLDHAKKVYRKACQVYLYPTKSRPLSERERAERRLALIQNERRTNKKSKSAILAQFYSGNQLVVFGTCLSLALSMTSLGGSLLYGSQSSVYAYLGITTVILAMGCVGTALTQHDKLEKKKFDFGNRYTRFSLWLKEIKARGGLAFEKIRDEVRSAKAALSRQSEGNKSLDSEVAFRKLSILQPATSVAIQDALDCNPEPAVCLPNLSKEEIQEECPASDCSSNLPCNPSEVPVPLPCPRGDIPERVPACHTMSGSKVQS